MCALNYALSHKFVTALDRHVKQNCYILTLLISMLGTKLKSIVLVTSPYAFNNSTPSAAFVPLKQLSADDMSKPSGVHFYFITNNRKQQQQQWHRQQLNTVCFHLMTSTYVMNIWAEWGHQTRDDGESVVKRQML